MESLSTSAKALSSKVVLFHVAAWPPAFASSFTLFAFDAIEADPLAGVCFVSPRNPGIRLVAVALPVTVALVGASYFLFGFFSRVFRVYSKMESGDEKEVVRSDLIKRSVFVLCFYLCGCHLVAFEWQKFWNKPR